ncbi:MAG: hypothetical protein D6820_11735, partial [Lentisphaerae bacterium]
MAALIERINLIQFRDSDHAQHYVQIELDDRETRGYGGPLYPGQRDALRQLLPALRRSLCGRDVLDRHYSFQWLWQQCFPEKPLATFERGLDPLTGCEIWNQRRPSRHTATGNMVCALSAVDNALWDLRGILDDKPVAALLSPSFRKELPAYLSTVPSGDLSKDLDLAEALYEQGGDRQKWFFRWGPADGPEGLHKTASLAEGLRTRLGDKVTLMFDFAVGQRGRADWDIPFAREVASILEPLEPLWLEEPFSPEEIDCYRALREATSIPIATGEHSYSRWHILPFLKEGLIDIVQCDPEWCGGISEVLSILDILQKQFPDKIYCPHGHHVLASSQLVAAHSPELCPMVEHGWRWLPAIQHFQTATVEPENGYRPLPATPG